MFVFHILKRKRNQYLNTDRMATIRNTPGILQIANKLFLFVANVLYDDRT